MLRLFTQDGEMFSDLLGCITHGDQTDKQGSSPPRLLAAGLLLCVKHLEMICNGCLSPADSCSVPTQLPGPAQ